MYSRTVLTVVANLSIGMSIFFPVHVSPWSLQVPCSYSVHFGLSHSLVFQEVEILCNNLDAMQWFHFNLRLKNVLWKNFFIFEIIRVKLPKSFAHTRIIIRDDLVSKKLTKVWAQFDHLKDCNWLHPFGWAIAIFNTVLHSWCDP